MQDYLHKFLKSLDYQRGWWLWIMLLALLVSMVGCPVKVASLIDPGQMVTREEYNLEVTQIRGDLDKRLQEVKADMEILESKVVIKDEEFLRKEELRMAQVTFLENALVGIGGTIGIPPVGMTAIAGLAGLVGVAGVGLTKWDKHRADNRIKELESKIA